MQSIIGIIQLVVAVILIVLVILQDRGEGLSDTFGGGGGSGFSSRRRGFENAIHVATIVGVVVFALTSLANLLIR